MKKQFFFSRPSARILIAVFLELKRMRTREASGILGMCCKAGNFGEEGVEGGVH